MKTKILATTVISITVAGCADCADKEDYIRPNIILIMTDDQGYGDMGFTGNPWIKTPNMDKLANESVRFSDFHVGTTCAPTRAGLMTGRHNNRVGVWHTIMGRSLLRKDEVTLADVLRNNGYATGMFGKWHLGDNYPYRPHDRGFDEAFYHGAGGVFQIADYWDNNYFDDTYFRNGVPEKTRGYSTDVWFSNAIDFIERNKEKPFFCYLSTNAPHSPFHVPQEYLDIYKDNPEVINPAFYGMITNIDDNIGILRKKLEDIKIADNTILIFMTDNGTSAGMEMDARHFLTRGYNAGMRGRKGSEYNGGHRVPFFIYWEKGVITGGRDVKPIASFMDIMPTLLDLCAIPFPDVEFDGLSLKPLIYNQDEDWPERVVIIDTQRELYPVKWKNCAVMDNRWHLINGKELYNMQDDPGQTTDISEQYPEIVERLREAYVGWWNDISPRFDEYSEIIIDIEKEYPFRLTSHDMIVKVGRPPWNQVQVRRGIHNIGFWVIDVASEGTYEFSLRRWPVETGQPLNASLPPTRPVPGGVGYPEGIALNFVKAGMRIGQQVQERNIDRNDMDVKFRFDLSPGVTRLKTWLKDEEGLERGAYYVYVSKITREIN